jgi:hypothetical protein
MNIGEFILNIKQLALTHKQIVSVHIGNTYDIATSKSSERYPNMWIELPILIDYNDPRKKTYTLALNFLSLCKSDDIEDAVNKTSDMEVVCDEMLQAIQDSFRIIGISDINAITLRNFSDDDCVGVRTDITFTVGRTCDIKSSFNKGF